MKANYYFSVLVILTLLASSIACSNRYNVQSDYKESFHQEPHYSVNNNNQTTVLFLVDGLSNSILKKALEKYQLANIRKHFLSQSGQYNLAKAAFPSVTFANITSILTASPINEHGIIGNKILRDNKVINFEEPNSMVALNAEIRGKSVFQSLGNQGLPSASFSYQFHIGATGMYQADFKNGLDYLGHDYAAVDEEMLQSLETFLNHTSVEKWPRLIFVHLVGIDGLAHDKGPNSQSVHQYMSYLDQKLENTFKLIRNAESKGRKITSLLTADHGFMQVKRTVDFEELAEEFEDKLRVVVEPRTANIYFDKETSNFEREKISSKLVGQSGVDYVIQKNNDIIKINSKNLTAKIKYEEGTCQRTNYKLSVSWAQKKNKKIIRGHSPAVCPEDYETLTDYLFHPFFVGDVARFFTSTARPDLLVVASDGVSFLPGYKGNHGGFTEEEMLVPVLSRNYDAKTLTRFFPTYELLAHLKTESLPVAPVLSDVKKYKSYQLELFLPLSQSVIESRDRDSGVQQNIYSKFSSSLGAMLKSDFQGPYGYDLIYKLKYEDFQQENKFTNHFEGGPLYNISAKTFVFTNLGIKQYLNNSSLNSNTVSLERNWSSFVNVGTQYKFLTLGFEDFYTNGGLSFHLPYQASNQYFRSGFGQNINFSWRHNTPEGETYGVMLNFERLEQNSDRQNQIKTMLDLGFHYKIDLFSE